MSASVEHGGKAFEKSGAAPPVVITMPDAEGQIGASDKVKKESRLAKYFTFQNYFRLAKYQFVLLAMVAIILLAVQVSKDQDRIQKFNDEVGTTARVHNEALEGHVGGRMSYLEGFSGMVDNDDTAVLAARDVMVSGDPSTTTSTAVSASTSMVASTIASNIGETSATETCTSTTESDTTVNVLKTTTILSSTVSSVTSTEDSTSTSDTSQTTMHTQMTLTVFSNTSGIPFFSAAAASSLPSATDIFSMDPLSASVESSMATTTTAAATASTTSGLIPNNPSHCLEFGDGAGPCNRPYGAPNTPPSSIVLSFPDSATTTYPLPSLSTIPSTSPSLPGGVIPSSTALDTTTLSTGAVSSTISTTSSTISNMETSTVSGTEATTSSTTSAMDISACGPPTTIYVTLSASADTLSVEGGVTIASFGTTTASGPSTVTSTSTSRATTITVSVAAATETLSNSSATTTSSHILTATGFTLTMTAHGNGTYMPTTTGPATIATLPANSGGDKAAGGKPMGARGNGGTGNGIYCAVMLVTLLALLI